MTIEEATEVFVRGFSYTRSFTQPYLVSQEGPLWIMKDAPQKEVRRGELVTCSQDSTDVLEEIGKKPRGRYALCVITATKTTDDGVKDAYKAAGYRLGHTEGMFVLPLRDLSPNAPELPEVSLHRVKTSEQAEEVKAGAGSRQILPKHLKEDHPSLRLYYAKEEGKAVAWVRSIRTDPKNCWVSNMYVVQEHRRRGIARALMHLMLNEDREEGAENSVLLASHTGALLYPNLGYQQIGTLHLFTPIRSRP